MSDLFCNISNIRSSRGASCRESLKRFRAEIQEVRQLIEVKSS